MWVEYPGPVWCHQDTAGADTACPGEYWTPWIRGWGWIDDLGVLRLRKIRQRNNRVISLTKRLTDLGYMDGPQRVYDEYAAAAVSVFQLDHALTGDGVCGPATWRALGQA